MKKTARIGGPACVDRRHDTLVVDQYVKRYDRFTFGVQSFQGGCIHNRSCVLNIAFGQPRGYRIRCSNINAQAEQIDVRTEFD